MESGQSVITSPIPQSPRCFQHSFQQVQPFRNQSTVYSIKVETLFDLNLELIHKYHASCVTQDNNYNKVRNDNSNYYVVIMGGFPLIMSRK